MHTEECDDWRDWWPQGSPDEKDISTLPAAGSITSPIRLGGPGKGKWIGVWGNFQGYRLGFSPAESFQVMPGVAIAYPFEADLYESIDTGGSGTRSIARFITKEAALAWGGQRPSAASKIVGAPANFSYAADGITDPTVLPGTGAFGFVQNDRTGLVDRLRQPDSFTRQSGLTKSASWASTGVKATLTASQNGKLTSAGFFETTVTTGGAGKIVLEIIRSAVTYFIGGYPTGQAFTADAPFSFFNTGSPPVGPIQVLAGDVINVEVIAAYTTGVADVELTIERERAAF